MVHMLGGLQTVPELSQPLHLLLLLLLLLFSQDDPVLRRPRRIVRAIKTTAGIVRHIRISAVTTGTVHVDVCHVGGCVTKGMTRWTCHVGRVKGGVARWACHVGRVKGDVMAGRVVVGVAGRQVCTLSRLA